MSNSLDTKFARIFERRVNEVLIEHQRNLADGSATRDDAFSTAMEYARMRGIITALQSVLTYLNEAEDELFGRKRKGD